MSVIDEIAAERRRQIEVGGSTPSSPDWWARLVRLGVLRQGEAKQLQFEHESQAHMRAMMIAQSLSDTPLLPQNCRRDLIRAAALIVAEIERLDRAGKERTGR